jgi:hypothetical protein
MSRYISAKVRKELAQRTVCENYPNTNVIKDYDCPMWKLNNGLFDEAGCEFDHIDEWSKTFNNDVTNFQVLCISCHKVKTKRFMKNKCTFTTDEINNGKCLMDVEPEDKKRKRK